MALLEIRDLTKHFFRLSALSRVSLSVEPGELLGLIGPNGSGKTTLFNCVTGVLRPSAGQVFLRGEDITGRSADVVYRRGIARTFQLIQLFPEMTVLDNMLVSGQEKTGRRLLQFLDLPWDERCLLFHQNRRYVSTASREQVRRPVYASSVGRWKNYQKHIQELLCLGTEP